MAELFVSEVVKLWTVRTAVVPSLPANHSRPRRLQLTPHLRRVALVLASSVIEISQTQVGGPARKPHPLPLASLAPATRCHVSLEL